MLEAKKKPFRFFGSYCPFLFCKMGRDPGPLPLDSPPKSNYPNPLLPQGS